MPPRKIVIYPDPVLRKKAEPVDCFDDELGRLIDEMAESMYAAEGVGLSAPQYGVSKRVVVIDAGASEHGSRLLELVNPRVMETRGEQVFNEGCLSFPGIREDVTRAGWVKVEAQNRKGEPISVEGEEILAVALQHEIEHLDGVLLIDHMSYLKRRMAERKLKKTKRERE